MSVSVVIRRYGKLAALIFLCFVITVSLNVCINYFSTIRQVRIVGSNIKIEINEQKFPANLLFFPEDKIRKELLKEYPLVSDVTFARLFPSTLMVTVYSRVPIANLSSGKRTFYIDREGIIISDSVEHNTLPTIIIPDGEQIRIASRQTDGLTTKSLTIVDKLMPVIGIESITATQSSNIHIKTPVTNILVTQNSDITKIVDTLQTLLAGFRIKGTMPRIIDLRFTKPIVTY